MYTTFGASDHQHVVDRPPPPLRLGLGTHAEYVVLDREAVVPAPNSIPLIEARVLPANTLTALQGLNLLALSDGQTLGIVGAAGAVGGFALELAKAGGIKTYAVASRRDQTFIESRSATFVDRDRDPYQQLAELGVDGLLDTATIRAPALQAVRDDGGYVGFISPAAPKSSGESRSRPSASTAIRHNCSTSSDSQSVARSHLVSPQPVASLQPAQPSTPPRQATEGCAMSSPPTSTARSEHEAVPTCAGDPQR